MMYLLEMYGVIVLAGLALAIVLSVLFCTMSFICSGLSVCVAWVPSLWVPHSSEHNMQMMERGGQVATETRGALTGERVVRGREGECVEYCERLKPNGANAA